MSVWPGAFKAPCAPAAPTQKEFLRKHSSPPQKITCISRTCQSGFPDSLPYPDRHRSGHTRSIPEELCSPGASTVKWKEIRDTGLVVLDNWLIWYWKSSNTNNIVVFLYSDSSGLDSTPRLVTSTTVGASLGRRVRIEDEVKELRIGVCIRTAPLTAAGRSRFGKEEGANGWPCKKNGRP